MKASLIQQMKAGLLAALILAGQVTPLVSLPQNADVRSGVVAFQAALDQLTIQQQTERAIVHWQDFSSGAGETIHFVQPSANAAILNRVTGGQLSQLDGLLKANGQVYLINPNGIVVGAGGRIEAAGFLASTADYVDEAAFLDKSPMALSGARMPIIIKGTVDAGNGDVLLVADTIRLEEGSVVRGKNVSLQAREEYLVHLADGIFSEASQGAQSADGFLLQSGQIDSLEDALLEADYIMETGELLAGVRVEVNARALVSSGVITSHSGTITMDVDLLTQAKSSRYSVAGETGGSIFIEAEKMMSSGSFDATGSVGKGGSITLVGDLLTLNSNTINASGATGGGAIRVGGDFRGGGVLRTASQLDAFNVTVNADATVDGDGGTVVFWSDERTRFTGSLKARAVGSGDAGSGEVSSAYELYYDAATDLSAENGQPGVILWDPKNITITNAASANGYVSLGAIGSSSAGTLTTAQYYLIELQNGNLLLGNPSDDTAANDAGAIYLMDSAGAIISTLTGSNVDDHVGSHDADGYRFQEIDSDYIVAANPDWNSKRGAVTIIDSAAGLNGVVDVTNSLVGSNVDDRVGKQIVTLSNDMLVTSSENWNSNTGFVMWMNPSAPVVGNTINATNAFVGDNAGDLIGANIIRLRNDSAPGSVSSFVVSSPSWDVNRGAVTWFDGTGAIAGRVADNHSIYGTDQTGGNDFGDFIGLHIKTLNNGNFVTWSPYWGDNQGAVTWGSGTVGFLTTGDVTYINSFVGQSDLNHQIGSGNIPFGSSMSETGVVALDSGDYVVISPSWKNWRGAVTFGNGASGSYGYITSSNSFVGTNAQDKVGSYGVTELSDNAVVIKSANWNSNRGAATYITKSGGTYKDYWGFPGGELSSSNSMTGTTSGDYVGGVVMDMNNGNYALLNTGWTNNGKSRAGAFTYVRPSSKLNLWGTVTANNSLVGTIANDNVGQSVDILSNGNFVVKSQRWNFNRGAITWMSDSDIVTGALSAANSLVGGNPGDYVGRNGVALSNNHYVSYAKEYREKRGYVLWLNGNTGAITSGGTQRAVGVVDTTTALIGLAANDLIGSDVVAFDNGAYVIASSGWDGNKGALTWYDGTEGLTNETVSAANSLVGTVSGDRVGAFMEQFSVSGNAIAISPYWNNNTGAITIIDKASGITGTINSNNSQLGSASGDYLGLSSNGTVKFVELPIAGQFLILSELANGGNGSLDGFSPAAAGPGYGFSDYAAFSANINPSVITDTLNTGTSVILEANNDITIADAIIANNAGGDGGDLSFYAGRSIFINAAIDTDNGDLNLLANASAAFGVQDAYRDAGDAEISMGVGGSITAGTGNVTMTMDNGFGNTNRGTGDITLGNIASANAVIITGDDTSTTLTLGDTNSASLTVAYSGDITQGAGTSLLISGATNLLGDATSDISFTSATNDFGGAVSVLGTNVALTDTNALELGAATVGGTYTIIAGGNITNSGALNITGAASFDNSAGTDDDIILNDASNAFSSTITFTNDAGSDITLVDTTSVDLRGITAASLSVTAGGDITDSFPMVISGSATFNAAGHDIFVSDVNNDFQGSVSLNGRNVTVYDRNALELGASTVTGTLDATARGNITNSGDLIISGVATFSNTLGFNDDIILDSAGNTFSSDVVILSDAYSDITITDTTALELSALSALHLTVTAGGNVTQSGALSVSGNLVVSAAGSDVILNNPANNIVGTAEFTAEDVSIVDVSNIILGASTATGTFSITAGGSITNTGDLIITGLPTFDNTAGTNADIILTSAGNQFPIDPVFNTDAGSDLSVTDTTALNLHGMTLKSLTVIAGGDVNDTGDIIVSGNVSITAAGNDVVFDQAGNVFGTGFGVVSNNASVSNYSGSLTLLASTLGNNLSISNAGFITAAQPLVVSGLTTLDNSGGNNDYINLNNASNNFQGGVNITTDPGSDVNLRNLGALSLGNMTLNTLTVNTGGALTLGSINTAGTITLNTNSSGNISATGSVVAGGNVTLNAAGFDVDLSQVGSDFQAYVRVNAADNVILRDSNDVILSAMTTTGDLTVYASGEITSGQLVVGGNAVFDNSAGADDRVMLNYSTNNFQGSLSITTDTGSDVNVRNSGALSLGDITLNSLTARSGGALTLGNVNTASILTLNAGGNISATGTVVSGGNVTLNAAGFDVDLSQVGSDFQAYVRVNAADNVILRDSNDIVLIGVTTTGDLTVYAGGEITSGQLVVGGNAVFDNSAGADDRVMLNYSTNNFQGDVTILGDTGTDINVTDQDAINFGNVTGGSLNVDSGGNVSDSGNIAIGGSTQIDAGANGVTLDSAGNDFSSISLTADSATINDTNAVDLTTTTIANALRVSALGDVTDSGVITVNGDALIQTTGNITLNSANRLTTLGFHTNDGANTSDVSVTNAQSLDLLPSLTDDLVLNITGNLTDSDSVATNTYTGGSPHPFTGQAGIITNSHTFTVSGSTTLDDPDNAPALP